ncbi:MAG: peptidoglycan-binding protein [Bacillus sp. (in: Bacteria)]|nr:peptidoglycan-binding protein [Bacillus sp. (in: firmicutes)]
MNNFQGKLGITIVTSVTAAGVFLAAPSTAEASFGQRNLSFGMTHGDVVVLQEQLKELGYFKHHTATGYFGQITRQAVQDFQRAHRLTPDGIVGPKTFDALRKAGTPPANSSSNNNKQSSTSTQVTNTASKPQSQTTSSNQALQQLATNQTLRVGSRGSEVEKLQQYLMRAGFFDFHTATGYYGTITEEAVRRFQRSRGLAVDGIAGRQTLAAVNKEISVTGSSTNTPPPPTASNTSSPPATPTSTSQTNSSQPTPPAQSAQPSQLAQQTGTMLQVGSRGAEVSELQARLKILGYFKQEPTGFFGEITRSAVMEFQGHWNLVADGLVTQSTWNKLEEVSSVHLENAEPGASVAAFNVLNLVADAGGYLGTPYVWGGTSGAGFDCSGFIQYIFRKNGVNLPRTVAEQWNATVSVTKLKVGDIVYFETYKAGPSHNGIYIGNNQFIHSGSSTGVTISNLSSSYWSQRYLGAKRIN